MSATPSSATKVSYDLRPAKQIERRVFLDSFQSLTQLGFPLRTYTYVGFGSIYFYDFSMFYRYLGITKMISLEQQISLKTRVHYNRPFENIEIRMESAETFIPSINRGNKYIIWFDYDYIIDASNLSDVVDACALLPTGSIFIVTIEAERPLRLLKSPTSLRRYVERELKDFIPDKYPSRHFNASNLAALSRDLLLVAIHMGLKARLGVEFAPLWSIRYKDTREMYTFGGMIVTPTEKAKLMQCKEFYYSKTPKAPILHIKVPRLTRKERIALDQNLPAKKLRLKKTMGIGQGDLDDYRDFHRYFPWYSELF